MAKKVFKTDLSVEGINNLKKELLSYKTDFLQSRLVELVEKLAEKGVEIAKANVTKLDAIFTGELIDSLHSEKGSASKGTAIFYIVTDSKHAAFVEFGTGVVGQNSPHKNGEYLSKAAWQYATGPKIFTTQDGRVGWIYPTDDGGFRFTEGMKSRPFMYETALELQREFPRIAKEVFGT